MKDIELKPCPFCGSAAFIDRYVYSDGSKTWCISCWHDDTCIFRKGMLSQPEITNKHELARAWNRRAE